MEKEFIPYEQALALKELGFDEECFAYYYNKELSFGARVAYGEVIECPLKQQAFRWFREKYGLNSHIHQENRNNYSYCCGQGYSDEIGGYQDFKTYEEAELECLKKLIEIVKNK
jgi:hypothetical protein